MFCGDTKLLFFKALMANFSQGGCYDSCTFCNYFLTEINTENLIISASVCILMKNYNMIKMEIKKSFHYTFDVPSVI